MKRANAELLVRSVPKAPLANKVNAVYKESWVPLDLLVSPLNAVTLDHLDRSVRLVLVV